MAKMMPKMKSMVKEAMSSTQLTELIRKRAQELYERRGRQPGHDKEDWLEAERQVKRECSLAC